MLGGGCGGPGWSGATSPRAPAAALSRRTRLSSPLVLPPSSVPPFRTKSRTGRACALRIGTSAASLDGFRWPWFRVPMGLVSRAFRQALSRRALFAFRAGVHVPGHWAIAKFSTSQGIGPSQIFRAGGGPHPTPCRNRARFVCRNRDLFAKTSRSPGRTVGPEFCATPGLGRGFSRRLAFLRGAVAPRGTLGTHASHPQFLTFGWRRGATSGISVRSPRRPVHLS